MNRSTEKRMWRLLFTLIICLASAEDTVGRGGELMPASLLPDLQGKRNWPTTGKSRKKEDARLAMAKAEFGQLSL